MIKIKPVLCGKKKCNKLHFIFAYQRSREADGKIHERYLGKAVALDQKGSLRDQKYGSKYDEVYILPPHTGKYRSEKRGKITHTKFVIKKSKRIRALFKELAEDCEEE